MNAVSKKPRAHNETLNFISIKNDSIITPETDFLNFDTFDEPLDERNIELNYELYAAAVFLFALGQISQWYVNKNIRGLITLVIAENTVILRKQQVMISINSSDICSINMELLYVLDWRKEKFWFQPFEFIVVPESPMGFIHIQRFFVDDNGL